MRLLSIGLLAFSFAIISFSQVNGGEGVEDVELLVQRDGLFYKKFSNNPFTGEVTGGTDRGFFRVGKRDGAWALYYDNGQLYQKGQYVNGQRQGTWFEYDSEGTLTYKSNYKKGKLDGTRIVYRYDGAVLGKQEYKNGVRHGWSWQNHENGRLLEKGNFVNGKRDGEHISCNSVGMKSVWGGNHSGFYEDGIKIDGNRIFKCGGRK